MGHYYSEMITDKEWEETQKMAKARHDRVAANLKSEIETRGIEHVLADILIRERLAYHYDREPK